MSRSIRLSVGVAEKGLEPAIKELDRCARSICGRSGEERRSHEHADVGDIRTRLSERSVVPVQRLAHQSRQGEGGKWKRSFERIE